MTFYIDGQPKKTRNRNPAEQMIRGIVFVSIMMIINLDINDAEQNKLKIDI